MPVLTGLSVSGLDEVAPARVTALHAGAPLTVFGRWSGGPVTVTATGPDGRPWSVEVPVGDGTAAIGAVWARARIRDLEDRYVVTADPEVERQIVRVSLDGHVLSRFTAFVAVESSVVNDGGPKRRIVQPVDAPDGWDMFGGRPTLAGGVMPLGMAVGAGGPADGRNVRRPMSAAAPAQAPMAMPAPAPMVRPTPMPSAAPKVSSPARRRVLPEWDRPAKEKKVALDLGPYRERAAALVRRATAGEIDAYALRRDLTDLVDDLRSVGAGEDVTGPLAAALAGLTDDAGPAGWAAALDALRAFTGDRRTSFWRRSTTRS
jgi:Ca-activated chloride channel family protein